MVACYHLAIAWWFSSSDSGSDTWTCLCHYLLLPGCHETSLGLDNGNRGDVISSHPLSMAKGACTSAFGHIWNASCLTYCVNYVFVIIYILDLESCQIINKYHVSVSISISIENYIYVYVSIYILYHNQLTQHVYMIIYVNVYVAMLFTVVDIIH